MRKNTYFYMFMLSFVFFGCASVQEKCQGYGFTPGTVEFANCNMSESHRQQQDFGNFMGELKRDSQHHEHMGVLRQQNINPPRYQQRSSGCSPLRVGNYSVLNC